jgi:hypothetical protein
MVDVLVGSGCGDGISGVAVSVGGAFGITWGLLHPAITRINKNSKSLGNLDMSGLLPRVSIVALE